MTTLDPKENIKALERVIPALRSSADLAELGRVQVQAAVLAQSTAGRMRRKAERVADKASEAAAALRASGVETVEERANREARESREELHRDHEDRLRLSDRNVALLHLFLQDETLESRMITPLRRLIATNGDGYLRIELPDAFLSWAPLLLDGYKQSRRLFASVNASLPSPDSVALARLLKTIAVELMRSGADLRGLSDDAVPLIAYSLFTRQLPSAPEANSSSIDEKLNGLLLSSADEVSALPIDVRPTFVGLFQLAVLIGEAQAYADTASLTSLTFD